MGTTVFITKAKRSEVMSHRDRIWIQVPQIVELQDTSNEVRWIRNLIIPSVGTLLPGNQCFQTGDDPREDPWESLGLQEIKQVLIFIGRIVAEAEAPILWPPDAKSWLIGKAPDVEKD